MLTVKHVTEGQEHIYQAPFGATYVGPHSQTGCGGPHILIPKAEEAGRFGVEAKMLHGGRAFVMNENGATVGSYELGKAPALPTAQNGGASLGETN